MDERIAGFMDTLKKNLEGLPAEEINQAVSYYEEYLNDAEEAGKDIGEVLQQLDLPDAISLAIKADTSIARAKRNPGLKNFAKAMSYAFKGIKTPAAFTGVSLFVFIAYLLVITFAAGAFSLLIGAAGAFSIAVCEALAIPSGFVLEKIGTIGIGLLAAGICLFVSYSFYKLCRLLIVLSASFIHRLQKKSAIKLSGNSDTETSPGLKRRSGKPVLVISIITLSGLVLFMVSGLPVRYFTLFNSMKPQNVSVRTMEYEASKIKNISIATAQSHINLTRGASDKIAVSYEQPDWLDYDSSATSDTLNFTEKSNGRLSLFKIISLHESVTEVNITIPADYNPKSVKLESTGGFISIKCLVPDLKAVTYTGNLAFTSPEKKQEGFSLKASTGTGSIVVNNKPVKQKPDGTSIYTSNTGNNSSIVLESSRGSINIAN